MLVLEVAILKWYRVIMLYFDCLLKNTLRLHILSFSFPLPFEFVGQKQKFINILSS